MAKYQQPNMQNLMKQAQKMQEQMAKAEEEILAMEFTATSGGGAVKVVMGGDKRIKELFIDPEAVNPEDSEMLSDMIVAAVNEVYTQAETESAQRMNALTGNFKLPGMR
ncbi:MAG: YbaB/EbfC family nucleoid-associated protein [Eubacteriaceae bacterium]|nr:YbaB/EbfC family nucleoid-associated protein [Eubacteriaceae bacterium]